MMNDGGLLASDLSGVEGRYCPVGDTTATNWLEGATTQNVWSLVTARHCPRTWSQGVAVPGNEVHTLTGLTACDRTRNV